MRLPRIIKRHWRNRFGPKLFPKSHAWPQQNWKARRLRGKQGWTNSDVWNADSYLAEIIAGMLEHLADIDHGHPMEYSDNPGGWPEWLRETAALFRRYVERWDYEGEGSHSDHMEAADAAAQEGLDRLKDKWGSLWD